MSSESDPGASDEPWIRFSNRYCWCGHRKFAVMRISQSATNPGRVYWSCKDCGYFTFWEPTANELVSILDFARYYASRFSSEEAQLEAMRAKYASLQAELKRTRWVVVALIICIFYLIFYVVIT